MPSKAGRDPSLLPDRMIARGVRQCLTTTDADSMMRLSITYPLYPYSHSLAAAAGTVVVPTLCTKPLGGRDGRWVASGKKWHCRGSDLS